MSTTSLNTADTKFTIADISSTLTSTPPSKANVPSISLGSVIVPNIADVIINDNILSNNNNPIKIEEFTTNVRRENGVDNLLVVLGNGLFDKLMVTATEHLAVQYENGRIRGEDYATAYIQVYQATLQTASNIWLQKGINEKQLALQLATVNAQIKTDIAKTNAQLKLEVDKSNAVLGVDVDKTSAQLEVQVGIAKNQNDLQWAIALLQRDAQEPVVKAQADFLVNQAIAEESKKDLYRRQIEGFDEDYKQKILKIMMDSWAVGFSVARDSFEASGIPAPMQKVTIDSLYNQYVVTELDKYVYGRPILNKP